MSIMSFVAGLFVYVLGNSKMVCCKISRLWGTSSVSHGHCIKSGYFSCFTTGVGIESDVVSSTTGGASLSGSDVEDLSSTMTNGACDDNELSEVDPGDKGR